MSLPVVEGRSSGITNVNQTTHPITMPEGIVAGELLLIVFSADANPTCTASAGWTKLAQHSHSIYVTGAIFYKIAEGGDTCTIYTTDAQNCTHIVFRISGAGTPTGTPYDTMKQNADPPLHDTGIEDEYLWIATFSADADFVASAAPANYSNLLTKEAPAYGASSSTAERLLSAASEDPGAFTSGSTGYVCWTLAIPPGAAPTAPTVTTQVVSNVGRATAKGHGNVTDNGGENPDDRRVEWGTSSGNYPNSCSAGGGGTGAFSCGLTGLSRGTTYYVRAKAHNSGGWGYGNEVSFIIPKGMTWGAQAEAFAELEEIERHVTHIFPDDTSVVCKLTADTEANTWSDYTEIVDTAGEPVSLSSKFASNPGYIAAMVVEDSDTASTLFMSEISYGASHTIVSRHRVLTETNKLPTVESPRVRGAEIPAGETVYYRCMCATAGGKYIDVHFRYYFCLH